VAPPPPHAKPVRHDDGAGAPNWNAVSRADKLARLAALAAGVGVLPATAAGLRVEVVYTALTVAGAAALLAADRGRTSAR
jgi:hypothetical protein